MTAADPTLSKENLSFYHNNKGLALYQSAVMIGDSLYECIKEYDAAIEKSDNNADNYFNRGNARLQQQDFELAHDDFDKGIQLDPNNAKLYHAKGLAF